MGIKVVKFGGSSVADAIQLAKVKDIVDKDSERRYVIVSAPGKRFDNDSKVTDLLYLCKTQIDHNIPCDQIFQVICDRYKIMEVNLGLNLNLEKEFDVIREKLTPELSADYIASRGEYLNAIITAAYLGYDFVDTKDLIKFDEKGRFLAEETNEALAEELAKHDRAVIPGFYGSKPDGSIKTFSRGGSDITGSLVARAVKADVYENWTDVSGFLMADPRIVADAKPIKNISYKELRELSYMGASVLHEDAVFPVRKADIPINIRNTNIPDDEGTIIVSDYKSRDCDQVITGIAGRKDFTVIAIYKNMMNAEVGFVKRILGILENYDVSFEHIPSGIDTVSVVISNKVLEGKLADILEDFEKQLKPDTIDIYEDTALIATVGHNMTRRHGVAATLMNALAENDINIRMIDQGSSEMNIIVGIENKDFEKAIKGIYRAFVK